MQPARLCFRSAGRPSRCSPRPSARPRRLRRGDATRSPARCGPGAIGRRRCELRRRAPGSLFPPGGAEINFCAAGDMSKKKGLSFEEKRVRMMEIFFETKDVFQLKDIEKIAPKEKGITSVSVKEILQSLVDDGMVDTDRIGTSNYFWAFPSKALHARKRKLEDLESQFAESSQKKETLQKSIEKSKIGRENTAERAALIEELAALRQKKEQLKAEIEKYRECDPDVIEEMRQTNKVAKEAANRWTDNIFSIKSWAKRKFGFEESRIDKSFGIPEDLDYID
ncbi:meiotic nuclear division protein 1 homolog isoform X4 [Columba livia]|uniref:meiotic nuclear division protein 1 homolog isoform X4 n=1 Tax=Columba livia TaxID=8932 RepID=UPI0031BAE53A